MSSTRREALRFAMGACALLMAIGVWLWLRKHHATAGTLTAGVGGLLVVAAVWAPALILRLRACWMMLAAAIGWVNSRILLGIFFFLVLTPIAIIRRGRKPVALSWRPGARASYWQAGSKRDGKHYEHPY